MKDYYVILGVLPDAEDIVIKAAYKALVQRYHPDRYKGNAQEAQRKTAELNEAYEILSNPAKRTDYDRTRKASQGSTSDYDEEESNDGYSSFQELDEDWQFALEYYPDLAQLEARLRKISMPLSVGFRQAMLETKEFNNRQKIANILEQRFLENYFGSHPKVIEFAIKLILDGKKSGAKELNKAVNIFGSGIDVNAVINKLSAKHYAEEIAAEERRKKAELERKKAEFERKEQERKERELKRQQKLEAERLEYQEQWERERPEREARKAREKAAKEARERAEKKACKWLAICNATFVSIIIISLSFAYYYLTDNLAVFLLLVGISILMFLSSAITGNFFKKNICQFIREMTQDDGVNCPKN